MYIQITERCNMKCDHCCYSCTSKGRTMDEWTYSHALNLVSNFGSVLSIGGGEPTTHRKFWQYLDQALENDYIEHVWLATNGKKTSAAWKLLEYMDLWSVDRFCVELSQDAYHEPIDSRIVEAYKKRKNGYTTYSPNFYPHIRNNTKIINVGRAKKNGIGQIDPDESCPCDNLFIDPDGNIFNCGCKQTQFGTVFDPQIPEDFWRIEPYDGGHNYHLKSTWCKEHNVDPEDYQGME